MDETKLKEKFLHSAPCYYNSEELASLFDRTIIDHNKTLNASYFLARVNKLNNKKLKNETLDMEWYSLMAEIHARYLIVENIKIRSSKILFSKNEDNDLEIIMNDKNYYVEVKSIHPLDFDLKYKDFLNKIREIPTGKMVSMQIKANKLSNELKEEIFKKIKLQRNYSNKDFELVFLKDIVDSNKTAFVDSSICYFINQTGLMKVVKKKLQDKPTQLNKADIIFLYSFHSSYDTEDIINVLTQISNKNRGLNLAKKYIICFTPWNSGFLYSFHFGVNGKCINYNINIFLKNCVKKMH